MNHKRFDYKDLSALQRELDLLGIDLPITEDVAPLKRKPIIYGKELPNSIAVQPMEGCDGTSDGSPTDSVWRRYERFARGGAGLLWFEACAVVPEGRANPRQLWLHDENADAFKALLENTLKAAEEANGKGFRPFTVLQLTHSGRYSKPSGSPAPVIAVHNPYLDVEGLEYKVITDAELYALEDAYVKSARLAKAVGFDAVDIKHCHRYLCSELLSARTREGDFGGSFENRTRFIREVVGKIKAEVPGIGITTRMNVFDCLPYPYGFGVSEEDYHVPELSEPIALAKQLADMGVELLDVTIGNPYYNPHVNRPYDGGPYIPPQHPLEGVATILHCAEELQRGVGDGVKVIASGLSYLRQYGPMAAAAGIAGGSFAIAGFGREAFAYPDFARDALNGGMKPGKCCIACGKCSELMRWGGVAGCVIRDSEYYMPIYKELATSHPTIMSKNIAEHV